MVFLSLFSFALFVLPAAVTVGVYIGIEHQAIFNPDGQSALRPGSGGKGGRLTTESYCQKAYGVTPFPGRYVFNPNQWGDLDDHGDLCMNITTDAGVNQKSKYAAEFAATWQYPPGPADSPVHAFPNAKLLLPNVIPVQVSGMTGLNLDVSWTYGMGNDIHNDTDNEALSTAGVNANMALDMFLDRDKNTSTVTTNAKFEVMVWLGRWGNATDPIGIVKGSQDTVVINTTTFDLYYGDNSNKQSVYTWVAQSNVTEFTGDIGPLIQRLTAVSGPAADDYLGYVGFGSETLYSLQNVTFHVPRLEMEIFTK